MISSKFQLYLSNDSLTTLVDVLFSKMNPRADVLFSELTKKKRYLNNKKRVDI